MDLGSLLSLPKEGLALFLLVLVRCSAIFLIAPVLGNSNTPARVKVGLSFMFAMILTPLISAGKQPHLVLSTPFDMAVLVFNELLIGFLIGFLAQLLFVAIEFAGQVVGLQMGFGMASVFDPQSHQQVSITSQLYLIVGVLTFMLLDGHHLVILALDRSFQAVPAGTFHLDGRAIGILMQASDTMFWTAMTLMAPVLGVLALTEVALAIVARIMPQMNIFVASFPIKVGVGIITMALSMPLLVDTLGGFIEQNTSLIFKFLGGAA